ncbi:MAG: tryptophan-rich sensory protein [Sphingomonadaceae bacterium]|nr:tryptophan-rich sensory protein [Sphingomonadaceae bacterium]
MTAIASKSQLRMSFLRYALITVPGVLLLGTLSGALAGAGSANLWFAALRKPPWMPPGWTFGAVWTCLYILIGLSLAMVLHAKGAKGRQKTVMLFALELVLAFAWPFLFFAWHQVNVALSIVVAMLVVAVALVLMAWRIRALAGLLLYPLIAWLMFAALLNFQIGERNPDAATLAPHSISTDIPL